MINNVVLVGRTTKDPELRYTPSNVAVATFSLAVNRTFKDANGVKRTLSTVLSGVSKLRIWLTGLKKVL